MIKGEVLVVQTSDFYKIAGARWIILSLYKETWDQPTYNHKQINSGKLLLFLHLIKYSFWKYYKEAIWYDPSFFSKCVLLKLNVFHVSFDYLSVRNALLILLPFHFFL